MWKDTVLRRDALPTHYSNGYLQVKANPPHKQMLVHLLTSSIIVLLVQISWGIFWGNFDTIIS